MAGADAELFFEEIDGARRKVKLRGHSAPHGGVRRDPAFHLGGTLRSVRTYEPGTGAAKPPSRAITGSSERDLEVKGHLRDGQLGDGEAERLRGLIESIRRTGRPLRITWNGLLRFGFLVETEFGIESGRDYTYRLRLEIDAIGEGTDEDALRRARAPLFPLDLSELTDAVSAHQGALLRVPGLSFDIASGITDLFAAVMNPLGSLIAAFEDIEAGIEDIGEAFKRAANAAAALLGRLQHLVGHLDAQRDPTEGGDASAKLAWERARTAAIIGLRETARKAYELGVEAERRQRGSTSGRTYVTAAGDTIESIAAREGTSAERIRALNPDVPLVPATATTLRLP
ncbi:MAG: LysM peptidoglycan-binding domain-containing protein [Deltaproteobacteria bacterium]|nr:LysM peptidoglycan-binding domain-containing protein [Deltaproteobacteria bacterium]